MTADVPPIEAAPSNDGVPSTDEAPRPGMRLGVWSIALAVGALIWAASGGILAVWAMTDAAPAPVGVIAYVLFLLGFFVIPVGSTAAVILGIMALVRSRVAGKVLGAIGLVLGLGVGAFVVSLILGSGGFFGAISF